MTELSVSALRGSRNGSLTVVISGELDTATVPRFAALTAGYAEARIRRLVMDVSGLAFADVAGLRALDAFRAQARQRGITVVMCGVSRQLGRLMAICGPGNPGNPGNPRSPRLPVPVA